MEQYLAIPLDIALRNGLIGFTFFYIISICAKFIYQKEALGEGDCWVMLGLCCVLPLSKLPWLVLIASIYGIIQTIISYFYKKKTISIAFVPCLALSQTFLLCNYVLY